jgi:hypothetical protein
MADANDTTRGESGNPKDTARDTVLRHLYQVHEHPRGMRVDVGFRDLASAMKGKGLNQAATASALDYLEQAGWVARRAEPREFRTARGTVQSSDRVTFKISRVGIDRLERASVYRRPDVASVNITNVAGVTVNGDHNVVNTRGVDAVHALQELARAIECSGLANERKLDLIADIGTLETQLAKPHPDRTIVTATWTAVARVADVASLSQVVAAAATSLAPFL